MGRHSYKPSSATDAYPLDATAGASEVSLIIRLPFPDSRLSPNRRNGKHWTSTVGAKNAQKEQAAWLTKEALGLAGPQDWQQGNIPLSLLYLCPDKRARDLDNLLSASKALLDAVAQTLGVDDRRFKPILIDTALGPKEGALIAAVGVTIVSGIDHLNVIKGAE